MAEIKNVIRASVHWHVKGVNATNGANDMLRGLPEELRCLFAQLRVNAANLSWIHPLNDWHAMGEADEPTRALIEKLVADARNKIVTRLPNGKDLIQVPNDDEYVFFRLKGDGEPQILFTGWGFKNSLLPNPTSGQITDDNNPLQEVRIGFSIEGTLCPCRQFLIFLAGVNAKDGITSSEGLYHVGPLKIGTTINVKDINTDKTFSYVVTQGTTDYVGDITEEVIVEVVLLRDDVLALTNERVTIEYRGDVRTFESQAGQPVVDRFILWDTEEMKVSAMGEEQSKNLTRGENIFTFNVHTPLAMVKVRVCMKHADETPCVAETVELLYGGQKHQLVTNDSGEIWLTMPYDQGQVCTVTTSIGAEQRELSATQEELFLFQETLPPPKFDYNIKFIDQNESPYSGARVVLTQGDMQWPITLDDNGCTVLPNGSFVVGRGIDVVIHQPSARIDNIQFELEQDEYEYVIQTEPKAKPAWWILWLLLFIMLMAVICILVYFVTDHACAMADPIVWPLLN